MIWTNNIIGFFIDWGRDQNWRDHFPKVAWEIHFWFIYLAFSLLAAEKQKQVESPAIKQHSDKILALLKSEDEKSKEVSWNILEYIYDQLIEHKGLALALADDRYNLRYITFEILREAWSEGRSSDESVIKFRDRWEYLDKSCPGRLLWSHIAKICGPIYCTKV